MRRTGKVDARGDVDEETTLLEGFRACDERHRQLLVLLAAKFASAQDEHAASADVIQLRPLGK